MLVVAAQVFLQARGQFLVTSTQLLFTLAPFVRAVDNALGNVVSVTVHHGSASIRLQVFIAAVVFLTAPVCGIFGFSFATKSTMTAIEPVAENGCLPSHTFDHLVQVPEPSLAWSYTSQQQQATQQG